MSYLRPCLGPLIVSLSLASGPAFTATHPEAAVEHAVPAGPDQVLRRGIDRLTGFLIGARDPTPEAVRAFLEHEVAPYFDFDYMAQWAVGPLGRRLSEVERARAAEKLRELFLGALARNLGSFTRPLPEVVVYPARLGGSGNEATVPARVVGEDGRSFNLAFRLYWNGVGWKVFDVAANGASAVAFYRAYFGNLLRRYGPRAVLE